MGSTDQIKFTCDIFWTNPWNLTTSMGHWRFMVRSASVRPHFANEQWTVKKKKPKTQNQMMRIKMQTFFMLKYAMSYFYVNISFKIVYIFFLQGEKKMDHFNHAQQIFIFKMSFTLFQLFWLFSIIFWNKRIEMTKQIKQADLSASLVFLTQRANVGRH